MDNCLLANGSPLLPSCVAFTQLLRILSLHSPSVYETPGELGVRSLPHRVGTQDALSAEEAPLEPPEGGVLFWKLCQVGLLVGLASRHQALPFGGSLTTEG